MKSDYCCYCSRPGHASKDCPYPRAFVGMFTRLVR